MASIQWNGLGADNLFQTATNWVGDVAPGTTDDVALLAIAGSTITLATDGIVNTLTFGPGATLLVGFGQNFSLTGGISLAAGTGLSANAGVIVVADNGVLAVGGSLVNSGTIRQTGSSFGGAMVLGGGNFVLSGAGSVVLADTAGAQNRIVGSGTLVNQDNTITGAGQIGAGAIALDNAGTIAATGLGALELNSASGVIGNTGLLTATNTGGLLLDSSVANASGTILASGAGAMVRLQNGATIAGGTLGATAGGGITVVGGGTAFLDGGTVLRLSGVLTLSDNVGLGLDGAIVNAGTIGLAATSFGTALLVSGTTTLSGGGQVVLSDSAGLNQIAGSGTLINVDNTISGAGEIGQGAISLSNSGTIMANGAHAIELDSVSGTIGNTGLLSVTASGGLLLDSDVANAGGTILANGANSLVRLQNGVTIFGGALGGSAGGSVAVGSGNTAALDGTSPLTFSGRLLLADNAALGLCGVITNNGTIIVAGSSFGSALLTSGTATLTGGGQVSLSDIAGLNQISGSGTLLNLNNTITGAGAIGQGAIVLDNAGTIGATGVNALTLSSATGTIGNTGLLSATGKGGLLLASSVVNAGGTVLANGTGTSVRLQNGVTIAGGTLATGAGGVVTVINGGTAALDGSATLALNGSISLADNTALELLGVIANTGTLSLAAGSFGTSVLTAGTVTLRGGGHVVLSDSASLNQIAGSGMLVNADNTITGAGQIGQGAIGLSNAGTIGANGFHALELNTGAAVITNTGLLSATLTGGLQIDSSVANAGGTILATGPGAAVRLQDGVTIAGGALGGASGGVVSVLNGGTATLDGTNTVSLSGSIALADNTGLGVDGVIVNAGTISLSGTSFGTAVLTSGTTTLRGGGHVVLSDTAGFNEIAGSGTLVNLDNTISGAGTIGGGAITLSNAGTIAATGSNTLMIDVGANAAANSAGGLWSATGKGGLILQQGSFSNAGTIAAFDGSAVDFAPTGVNTNLNAGTLAGGSWEADAISRGATLTLTGGPVNVVAANILLSGAGALLQAGDGMASTPIEASLGTIAAAGTLQLLNARGFAAALDLTDAGSIVLAGGTLSAPTMTLAVGGVLSGTGTLSGPVTDAGAIQAVAGTLVVAGAVGGAGVLQLGAGAALELTAAAATLVDFGNEIATLRLDAPAALSAPIDHLVPGDRINLVGIDATSASIAAGTLTVGLSGGGTQSYSLLDAPPFLTASAQYHAAGSLSPAFSTISIACFRTGTRILTSAGEIPVEQLRVGAELPVVVGRRLARVRWIGHRHVVCASHPRPPDVHPVRVQRGAFGPGLPARDLFLSPDHAICPPGREDVLIPVRYLVNGATIAQVPAPEVTYWHVELDRHDVLLAEGVRAESYLDSGNRDAFENATPGSVAALHPTFAAKAWDARSCLPLVVGGGSLMRARQACLDGADALGWRRTEHTNLHVRLGSRVIPPEMHGAWHRFHLPEATTMLRLVSRSSVPADIEAAGDDYRRLGVAVRRLMLDGRPVRVTSPRLQAGWHDAEPEWRWTDGNAVLDCRGRTRLDVLLGPPRVYWHTPSNTERATFVAS
jgi:hypothetical protein